MGSLTVGCGHPLAGECVGDEYCYDHAITLKVWLARAFYWQPGEYTVVVKWRAYPASFHFFWGDYEQTYGEKLTGPCAEIGPLILPNLFTEPSCPQVLGSGGTVVVSAL